MKIKVKWEISYSNGCASFDLDEVNCKSIEEWNNLSHLEKRNRLQECIDEMVDSPSMILERYYLE